MQVKSDSTHGNGSLPEGPAAAKRGKRGWLRRHAWLVLLLLLIAATATWFLSGRDTEATSRPLLATIERGDIENVVTAAGTLQPSRFVDVGAQVSGQLFALHADVGSFVKQGELLAEIDATVQINRVEASRASLQALEAQLSARQSSLSLAQANADRQTRLMKDDASTQADFDNAMNALASAQSSLVQLQSQIAQSKASLASEEAQLGYTKIYAPTDGTIVSVSMKVGQTLNANQQTPIILRIADLSTMTVEAEVSEADVTKLKAGMEAYFTTLGSGDRRWYGSLRQILPTPVVTNNVVLYTALFDVDNADGALLPSMTAQVFFITESARDVLKVPVGALTFAGPGRRQNAGARAGNGGADKAPGGRPRNRHATVQYVLPDGKTEPREVTIGVSSRIAAEVLSGLEEGDQVVAGIVQTRASEGQRPPNNLRFR